MKRIMYQIKNEVNIGSILNPKMDYCLTSVSIPYSEENIKVAQENAYDGYIVEDDGKDNVSPPSRLDVLESRVAYIGMMTGTLPEDTQ